MTGMIHLYEGDGQGKSTAAAGLALRMAGFGKRVVFAQFLKGNNSHELNVLKTVDGVAWVPVAKTFGFTFNMSEEDKKEARTYFTEHFREVIRKAEVWFADLLVLDEIVDACNTGMVDEQEVLNYLRKRPLHLEVVLTGHKPSEAFQEIADYHSRVTKIKHPYDKGIPAREGIEW